MVNEQKCLPATTASVFYSNTKTTHIHANLDDALIERKSCSPIQTVINEDFNMIMHLIEIWHSIVTIGLIKTYYASRYKKLQRLLYQGAKRKEFHI